MFCGQYRNIDVEYCIIMVSQHGIDFFNLFGKGNLKCEFLQLFMKTFMLKIIPFETHINNNSMKKKIYFFFQPSTAERLKLNFHHMILLYTKIPFKWILK